MEIYDEVRLSPSDPDYLPRVPLLTGRALPKSTRLTAQHAQAQIAEVLRVQPMNGDAAYWRLANGSGIRIVSENEPLLYDDTAYQAQLPALFGVDWIVTESGQLGPLV